MVDYSLIHFNDVYSVKVCFFNVAIVHLMHSFNSGKKDMIYRGNVIRPPSEGRSLILQVTTGCSHNKCAFCGAYPQSFSIKSLEELENDISWLAQHTDKNRRRLFLADGNALILSTDKLLSIMVTVRKTFPKMKRVGAYGNAKDILRKTDEELSDLREAGLSTVYIGLESGDNDVLKDMNKDATVEETIEAVQKLNRARIKTSVMALLGLAGADRTKSRKHGILTAEAANKMQPTYLSLLTVMLIPGTPLFNRKREGIFKLPEPDETIEELLTIVENLNLSRTVFRANHASNFLSLEGTLNKDKERLIAEIKMAIQGRTPLKPEFLRGL